MVKNFVLLELFLVIVSLVIFGIFFKNRRIILNTDNMGVVSAIVCPLIVIW